MTENSIIDVVMYQPAVRAMGGTDDEKRRSIKAILPVVKDEIMVYYDWDFTIKEATTTGVADQSQYTLSGLSDDCRDIINIRYDSDLRLLDKREVVDLDEYLSQRTISTVSIWTPVGREYGFPVVKITDAPDVSGKTIHYRYRSNSVELSDFPDEFRFVFISGVMKNLIPQFLPVFKKDLAMMVRRYSGEGGEDEPMKLDPLVLWRNNQRSTKFGWS